jgi:hypothetical protein
MVDRGRVLAATGEVLRGGCDAAIINDWLQKTGEGAFASVVTKVNTFSATPLTRPDNRYLGSYQDRR